MTGRPRPFEAIVKKYRTFGVCLFLVISTVMVYGQMLTHDFVNFDDDLYVAENLHVKAGLTAKGIIWAFSTIDAEFWHPLTWLSLMLDSQIFGGTPGGYLFTNLLLHIFNTLLLFLILKRTTATIWQSGFVAALFALHPMHVESVAWIAQRKDVLSTLFWMLTILWYVFYTERPGLTNYLAVLLFLILGLMAKPMLVTLPLILLLLDYWPLARFKYPASVHSSSLSILSLVREKTPFFAVAAAASIVAYLAQQSGGGIKSFAAVSLTSRMANALVSYVGYIGKMLWPFKLACFYPYPDAFPWWQVGGSLLLLALMSWFTVRSARRYPFFIFGWLWYLVTLLPVIGIVKIGGFAMADRYSYVPLIGIFVILTWGASALLARKPYGRTMIAGLAAVSLVICLVTAWFQVRFWQNRFTLFTHALNVTSGNYLAHNALGLDLRNQERFDEATHHLFEALRLKPNYLPTYINLGSTFFLQNKTSEAIRYFSEALRRNPNQVEAHESLGILFEMQGDLDKAIQHLQAALELDPENATAHKFLGKALMAQGKLDEAIYHYAESLRIQPDNANVHYNLGIALENQGKIAEAIEQYSTALKINPEDANAHYNLANLMAKQNRLDAAIEHYHQALVIQPELTRALSNLAFVYASKKEYQKAISSLLQLAERQPDNADNFYNVACLYAKQNKIDTAIEWLETAFKKGYRNCDLIKVDEDLSNVRASLGYDDLMNRYCR